MVLRKAGVALALLVPLVAAATASADAAAARPAALAWCGSGGASDWLCQRQGSVSVNDQELSAGSTAPVAPETKVTTASTAVARLVFPGEARCVVGHKPTELYTRVGGYGALYTQSYGDSACKTKGSSAHVFCGDPIGQCPRKMVLSGEALTTVYYSSRAHIATASSAEAYARFGRVVLCSGHVRIQLPGENGGQEQVIGRARPGMEWIVEFQESFAKVEEPEGWAEALTGAFLVVGYTALEGSCRSQVVRGVGF